MYKKTPLPDKQMNKHNVFYKHFFVLNILSLLKLLLSLLEFDFFNVYPCKYIVGFYSYNNIPIFR